MSVTEIADNAFTTRRPGVLRRLLRQPLAAGSLALILIIVLLGILAPLLSAHDPNASSLDVINAPPGTEGYLLGADSSGRDILARLLASINTAIISALIGSVVAVVVGVPLGLLAGYAGQRTDAVLSWVSNLIMTFPALVLLIVLYPATGGSYQVMMGIFGILFSPAIFRLVRNQVVAVRNELYVDAARVAGLSTSRILSRHVLPAVRGPVVISISFLAGTAIGVQSGLAFLGLGSNLVSSFGSMTADAFRNIYTQPIQFLWPTIMLAIFSGGFVLIGNGLRDVLGGGQPVAPKRAATAARKALHTAPATSSQEPGALLRVRNLRVSYPMPDGTLKAVVRGISFDLDRGDILGLIGESGSGKTQTAFAILGLLPAQAVVEADELSLNGQSLLGLSDEELRKVRANVAYVPQEPMSNLAPSFTVGTQMVESIRASQPVSRAEAKSTALSLLKRVGIVEPDRTFRSYPHEISGGMAQRVLIATAVATHPKLLIADEPTTALDVTVQAEILDLLRELQTDFDMTVLLVTHNFGVVADLCRRVAVMREGEIVETGLYSTLFDHAEHPYTQQLIGSILDESTYREDGVPDAIAREGKVLDA